MKDKLAAGPIMKRSCTDCICCLLFVIFVGGFIAGSGYGWLYGDPMKLTIGWDSDGNGCGYSPGFENHKYLYWPNAPSSDLISSILNGGDIVAGISGLLNQGTCVKTCPMGNN